jgi:hypothetical protein
LVRKNNDERKILLHDIGAVDFDHVQQVYDAVKYQLLRETNGDTKDQPSKVIIDQWINFIFTHINQYQLEQLF